MPEGGDVEVAGAGVVEDFGAGVEGGAGGEDVVDEDVASGGVEVGARAEGEGAAHVAFAFGAVEASLGGGFLEAEEEFREAGGGGLGGEGFGEETGLVKAAPAEAFFVEGNGDEGGAVHEVEEAVRMAGERAEVGLEVEAAAVFEFMEKVAGDATEDEAGATFVVLGVEVEAVGAAARAFDFAEEGPAAGVAVGCFGEGDFCEARGAEVQQGAFLDKAVAGDAPARKQDVEAGAAGGPQAGSEDFTQGRHALRRNA